MQLSDGGCPFHRAVRRREASKRTFELSGSGGDGKTPLRYRAFLVSRVRTLSGRAAVRESVLGRSKSEARVKHLSVYLPIFPAKENE